MGYPALEGSIGNVVYHEEVMNTPGSAGLQTFTKTVTIPMSMDQSILIPLWYGIDNYEWVPDDAGNPGNPANVMDMATFRKADPDTIELYAYIKRTNIQIKAAWLEIPTRGKVYLETVEQLYTGGASDDIETHDITPAGSYPEGSIIVLSCTPGASRPLPIPNVPGSRVYGVYAHSNIKADGTWVIYYRGDGSGDGVHRFYYQVIVQ